MNSDWIDLFFIFFLAFILLSSALKEKKTKFFHQSNKICFALTDKMQHKGIRIFKDEKEFREKCSGILVFPTDKKTTYFTMKGCRFPIEIIALDKNMNKVYDKIIKPGQDLIKIENSVLVIEKAVDKDQL